MILDFLIPLVVGAGVVSSSVQRTLHVHRGNVLKTTVWASLNCVFYYLSVKYIISENVLAYSGTCVGSILSVMWLAWKNNK